MANKQPLMDRESLRWTDSSQSIESKIHDACQKNETQKVTHFLLRRKKDITAKKLDEFGSLFVAIDNDNFLIVDGLLGIGCDPNVTNSNRYSALFVSLLNGNMCIASSLSNHGAKIEKTLFFAIQYELSDIVKKILELQVDIKKVKTEGYPGHTPLHLAIFKCNLEIVKLLLKHNTDPNRMNMKGDTPLYLAVSKGHIGIVKDLLNNGAEVDKKTNGVTPFLNALNLEQIDIAKILLKHGANVDVIINSSSWYEEGYTSLLEAAHHGKLEKVRFLLNHNANINAVAVHKRTPLHVATMFGWV